MLKEITEANIYRHPPAEENCINIFRQSLVRAMTRTFSASADSEKLRLPGLRWRRDRSIVPSNVSLSIACFDVRNHFSLSRDTTLAQCSLSHHHYTTQPARFIRQFCNSNCL